MSTESTFPALPVRQRGTLEIIDTAMKLYRRYFGVLMGWSALTAVLFLVTFSFTCGLGALLVYPLVPGAGCCAIAAAVRGQGIGFGQVWDFTKPRFGALIGITLLSLLMMSAASGALSMLSMAVSLGGTWILSLLNAPSEVTVVVAIIGTIIGTVLSSILSVVAYAWLGLIPIIACLEDDKRSTAALGRAWELMKGSWGRVMGLATLLSIAIIAVMGIVGGSMALFGSGVGAFADDASDTAIIKLLLTFGGFLGLFMLFWNPIQTLILTVLYLDLRVRKEALDLEWSSYASAPSAQTNAPELPTVEPATNSGTNNYEATPASLSGYAPDALPGAAAPEMRPPVPINSVPTDTAATSETRPPVPTNEASARPPMPTPAPVDEAPVSLVKQETSSFSSAPAISAPVVVAPASQPGDAVAPASEAFDFSSSFDAADGNDNPFSSSAPSAPSERGVKSDDEKN